MYVCTIDGFIHTFKININKILHHHEFQIHHKK